jgi:head-tail adaptor
MGKLNHFAGIRKKVSKPHALFLPMGRNKAKSMAYSAGFLHDIIQPLNRKEAVAGKYGLDSSGIEWEEGPCLHANVDYAKGKAAMNAGALDAYAVKIVRMRYNATSVINERSRIKFDGRVYQIIPEMFHPNHYDDTLQFHMQLIVNDK